MPKSETLAIAHIYVPVKRRGDVDPRVVQEIAESILQIGQQTPVLVRRDGDRLVLIEGLHRLEACKALGEESIIGCIADAHDERPRATSAYEVQADALRHKMERLRTLRLEKQAAERLSTPSATPSAAAGPAAPVDAGARDTLRTRSANKATKSKPASLSEWLSERQHDGFRH
jgi:hypothetical protein